MEEHPKFTYKVSKVCQNSLERQIWEGVEIQNSNTQRVINKKGEWDFNIPPGQVTVVRGEIWTQENRPDIGNKRARAGGGEPPLQQTYKHQTVVRHTILAHSLGKERGENWNRQEH